ncbi:MAG: hypothetical protein ACAI38_13470 [Myxococcota bacterium]|nr:hypothetical protein [Myxococcota bacterium]
MNRSKDADRVLVYENEPMTGARVTALFAIGTAIFSFFLAGYVFTSMNWGTQLAPVGQRLAWASVIAGGGLAFLGWAWLHNRKVTQRIFYKPGDVLELEHPSLFGSASRDVPIAALENADFHSGDPQGEERVNVPWIRIGVHHGRSFIVNLPGHVHRYDVFSRMLERAGFDPEDAFTKQSRVEHRD